MPKHRRLGLTVLAVVFSLAIAIPPFAAAERSSRTVRFARAKWELATFAHRTCMPGCKSRVYKCRRRSPRRVDCHAHTEKVTKGVIEPEHEFAIERTDCTWVGFATPSETSGPGYQLDVEEFLCVTHREFPRREGQDPRIASRSR